MSNGLVALLGLIVSALSVGVTIFIARMNLKAQARRSEQAHAQEMARDSAAFQRQHAKELRDWHAKQCDIALQAKMQYTESVRTLNGWANFDLAQVADTSADAEKLINEAIYALQRERGNTSVIDACKGVRNAYGAFTFTIQHRGSQLPNSSPFFQAAATLEGAIQQRLGELDAHIK